MITNKRIFTLIVFLIAINLVIWLSNNIDPITGQQKQSDEIIWHTNKD